MHTVYHEYTSVYHSPLRLEPLIRPRRDELNRTIFTRTVQEQQLYKNCTRTVPELYNCSHHHGIRFTIWLEPVLLMLDRWSDWMERSVYFAEDWSQIFHPDDDHHSILCRYWSLCLTGCTWFLFFRLGHQHLYDSLDWDVLWVGLLFCPWEFWEDLVNFLLC